MLKFAFRSAPLPRIIHPSTATAENRRHLWRGEKRNEYIRNLFAFPAAAEGRGDTIRKKQTCTGIACTQLEEHEGWHAEGQLDITAWTHDG